MKIKPDFFKTLNKLINPAELILGELVSHRKQHKLLGYAVIYDEDDIDFFSRKSDALYNAIYDIISWAKLHHKEIIIFTNANGEAAIKTA